MADEAPRRCAGREFPKAEGFVPGGGKSVGPVGGDYLSGSRGLEGFDFKEKAGIRKVEEGLEVIGEVREKNIRSRRRCESARADFAWDSRNSDRRG